MTREAQVWRLPALLLGPRVTGVLRILGLAPSRTRPPPRRTPGSSQKCSRRVRGNRAEQDVDLGPGQALPFPAPSSCLDGTGKGGSILARGLGEPPTSIPGLGTGSVGSHSHSANTH